MTEKKIAVTPIITGVTAILFFTNCQRRDYILICFKKQRLRSHKIIKIIEKKVEVGYTITYYHFVSKRSMEGTDELEAV